MDLNGNLTQSLEQLIQDVLPALVVVHGRRRGAGAGVIWSADGLILTNNHVVGRRSPQVKLHDDRTYEARLLARDPEVDLALLSIRASKLTPLEPASLPTRVGEMAFAFGHPWGQRNTVTRGIVSALLVAQTRDGNNFPVLRTDVPLAPGNSGGPLVSARGEILGINAMIMGGDQSIAIPVSVIKEFVRNVAARRPGERPARPIRKDVL